MILNLEKIDKKIKVISFDCFDTIFWRRVISPTDIFFHLEQDKLFKLHGITASKRIKMEAQTRSKKYFTDGSNEVNLEEIYKNILPNADQGLIANLIDIEINYEIDNGYIYKPIYDLLRLSKNNGLRVIVVSDTYFKQNQLKKLLFTKCPELQEMIEQVYCSCDFGVSKRGGIWKHIFAKLAVSSQQVHHIGDNYEADIIGSQVVNMGCTHLKNITIDLQGLKNSREQSGLTLFPQLRHSVPAPNFFNSQISSFESNDTAQSVGYLGFGPILLGFAIFIDQSVKKLESEGKNVKVGFLMRDGFLPMRTYQALKGSALGDELAISRFTSIAASLDSSEKISEYLSIINIDEVGINAVLRQLLLPSELIMDIEKKLKNSLNKMQDLRKYIYGKKVLQVIISNSLDFQKRLLKHIALQTGVKSGDSLLFVDLGYSGTTQSKLADIIKRELNVDVSGCYLIASDSYSKIDNRTGLINYLDHDYRIINSLTGNSISTFEMVCAKSSGSAKDYDENGYSVHYDQILTENQLKLVSEMQNYSIKFTQDFKENEKFNPTINLEWLAYQVGTDLTRLLHYPSEVEIDCFAKLDFDINLGSSNSFKILDTEKCIEDMRKIGYFYTNKSISEGRLGHSLELRHLDISLSHLYFTSKRFGFGINPFTLSYRKENIEMIVLQGDNHSFESMPSYSTFDGYFSFVFPFTEKLSLSMLFGKKYEWIQFICFEKTTMAKVHESYVLEINADYFLINMEDYGKNLYKLNENSSLVLPATSKYKSGDLFRVVFRPVIERGEKALNQQISDQIMH
jgi:predicted HAD superfamily hydrolase